MIKVEQYWKDTDKGKILSGEKKYKNGTLVEEIRYDSFGKKKLKMSYQTPTRGVYRKYRRPDQTSETGKFRMVRKEDSKPKVCRFCHGKVFEYAPLFMPKNTQKIPRDPCP